MHAIYSNASKMYTMCIIHVHRVHHSFNQEIKAHRPAVERKVQHTSHARTFTGHTHYMHVHTQDTHITCTYIHRTHTSHARTYTGHTHHMHMYIHRTHTSHAHIYTGHTLLFLHTTQISRLSVLKWPWDMCRIRVT